MHSPIRTILACCVLALAGCAGTGVTAPNLEQADVATVRGTLVLPEGRGPFPAVILLHGCSGPRPNGEMWARFLRDNGYASLILDSFGPRGVTEICTDPRRVEPHQRVIDSIAALRYLGTRPEIARERIAIMGFSHGGTVSLLAANRFWWDRFTDAPLRFRASIPLYPACRAIKLWDFSVPVRILIGDKDDWTPAEPCKQMVSQIKAGSAPVDLRIYPGGHHSFDDLSVSTYLGYVRNPNSPTGYGASVGGDARSLDTARADVLDFLRRHLGPG